jgi:hypothetical protein
MSSNFSETIGIECGKIMLSLSSSTYPETYNNINKRNLQFSALENCVESYIKAGGNVSALNNKYNSSSTLSELFYNGCVAKIYLKKDNKDKDIDKSLNQCLSIKFEVFKYAMEDECKLYNKDIDVFSLNNFLKEKCEKRK